MNDTYRTDDPVTRTYAEGIIAAAHGWCVCPHTGWQYRREWEMGYRDAMKLAAPKQRAARHRQPVTRERKAA